jgi:hypothetical protein
MRLRRRTSVSDWIPVLIAAFPFAFIVRLGLSWIVGLPYFLSDATGGRQFLLWLNTSWLSFLVSYVLTLGIFFLATRLDR